MCAREREREGESGQEQEKSDDTKLMENYNIVAPAGQTRRLLGFVKMINFAKGKYLLRVAGILN